MSLVLSKSELVELTDYKRRDKQIEALVYMDIPFRLTPTGAIKDLRSDLEAQGPTPRMSEEPNFDALDRL